MAFVAEGSQAFLSGNDDDDDNNFAALDSMTSGMSNHQSAFMQQQFPGNGGHGGMTAATNNNGGGGEGELGDSLFDRIRRRTEEQKRQQQQTAPTFSQQPSAQPSWQQQQHPSSTFVSQQPSAESSMELGLEREPSDGIIPTTNPRKSFDAAAKFVENRNNNFNNNNTNTAENTYSFAATAGEDFSFQPAPVPSVPTYGPSRNDPAYYSGATNHSQQYPASFQDKAVMAMNDAGSTMKSILETGMSGASTLVSSVQERMGGGGGPGGRGRYSNNFLLREDSLEQQQGDGNSSNNNNNMMHQPPLQPHLGQSEAVADSNGQAYSMLSYAKTFCEDLYGFLMQLPPLGKAFVVVILLGFWLLMRG